MSAPTGPLLVAAVGERPMETFRIANAVRPSAVWLLHTKQSAEYTKALSELLQAKLGVAQVDMTEVAPFDVPDIASLGSDGASSEVRQAPGKLIATGEVKVAIAATGGTKPMLWGVQRWYDALSPNARAGSFAVNEADGSVFGTDAVADGHLQGSQPAALDLNLAEVGALHLVKVKGGKHISLTSGQAVSGFFSKEVEFNRTKKKVCGDKSLPGSQRAQGALLERLVAEQLLRLGEPGQWLLNPKGFTAQGREFELDVVRCHNGRVWVLECKLGGGLGLQAALEDLAEVDLRARQLGGADARSAMLIFSPQGSPKGQERAQQLNDMQYLWVWSRPVVFGSYNLKALLGCGPASTGAEDQGQASGSVTRTKIGEFFAT